ncbi:hypothetical protein [Kordiimonas sp.]|uniref:hypothetical protein n=1 Tax=Kordiimonas sp. TaxID=1970157 RepID=UPI003A8D70A6
MAQKKSPDERKPIFRLPEGPINLAVGFVDFEEFRRWCNEQRSYIRSIPFPLSFDHTSELLAPYDRFLEIVETGEGEETPKIDAIQAELENAANSGLIVREHPVGEYLEKMGYPWTRAGYVARLLRVKVFELHKVAYDDRKSDKTAHQDLEQAIKGYSLAGAMPGVQLLLEKVSLRTYADVVSLAERKIGSIATELEEAKSGLTQMHDAYKESYNKVVSDMHGVSQRILDLEGKEEAISTKISETVKLNAGRKYWRKKSRWHLGYMFVYRLIFLSLLLLTGCIVKGVIYAEGFSLGLDSPIIEFVNALPQTWQFVSAIAVFLPLALFLWILKLVNNGAILHEGLNEDSKLRATILEVYLALLDERQTFSNEERALILNALVRPINPKSDEGPPIGLLDMLHQMATGNKTKSTP